jgi:hypothetical protein
MKTGMLFALGLVASTLACAGQGLLSKTRLNDADLPRGVRIKLAPGGYQVARQVTLDLCGGSFPSESDREARFQQFAVNPDGRPFGISDEGVVYESADAASQAFAEIRTAVAQCPTDRFVRSRVAHVPPQRYERLRELRDDQFDEIAPDHIALAYTVTDERGNSTDIVAVFQRRGRVMVGLYGEDVARVEPFVAIVAHRLAALSEREVEP